MTAHDPHIPARPSDEVLLLSALKRLPEKSRNRAEAVAEHLMNNMNSMDGELVAACLLSFVPRADIQYFAVHQDYSRRTADLLRDIWKIEDKHGGNAAMAEDVGVKLIFLARGTVELKQIVATCANKGLGEATAFGKTVGEFLRAAERTYQEKYGGISGTGEHEIERQWRTQLFDLNRKFSGETFAASPAPAERIWAPNTRSMLGYLRTAKL